MPTCSPSAWCALGPQATSFSACAAGAQAIANAAWAIRRGEVNIAIAGGHGVIYGGEGQGGFAVVGEIGGVEQRGVHLGGHLKRQAEGREGAQRGQGRPTRA